MLKWLLLSTALALFAATPCLAGTDANDIGNVFKAAFPTTSIVATLPANPPGCNCSMGGSIQVRLTAKADKLVDLGGDRFALVVLETDEGGRFHAEPGAVSIAYLQREPTGWRVIHVWREFAWTGNSGAPAEKTWTTRYGASQLFFLSSDYVAQGQHATTDEVITLAPSAPVLDGYFPAGGSVGSAACSASVCRHYAYAAFLHPPESKADLFAVAYRGWMAPKGKAERQNPFSARTDYRMAASGLVAVAAVKLPDQ